MCSSAIALAFKRPSRKPARTQKPRYCGTTTTVEADVLGVNGVRSWGLGALALAFFAW